MRFRKRAQVAKDQRWRAGGAVRTSVCISNVHSRCSSLPPAIITPTRVVRYRSRARCGCRRCWRNSFFPPLHISGLHAKCTAAAFLVPLRGHVTRMPDIAAAWSRYCHFRPALQCSRFFCHPALDFFLKLYLVSDFSRHSLPFQSSHIRSRFIRRTNRRMQA